MKKILVTSTELMMVQFLLPHIRHLIEQGYEVDLACSEVGGRFSEISASLPDFPGHIHRLSLQRSPLSRRNVTGYRQLKQIIEAGNYDLIWTNEPVMSVVTRLAARRARGRGTKVMYMAHGFHFYSGAPLLNWMVYYPIERLMARHADCICTVNTEDHHRVQSFSTPSTAYIHGIGINTARLSPGAGGKDIRRELGLSSATFIILSVGELNRNKNQATIIRALALTCNPDMHYVLCGKGYNEAALRRLAERLGVGDRVHFLGYRRDIVEICGSADIYAMPSLREGLPVSSLEAMYCGLPLLTSSIRGLTDVNHDGLNGYLCAPRDARAFADRLEHLYAHPELRRTMGDRNRRDVIPFTITHTLSEVVTLISQILNGQ